MSTDVTLNNGIEMPRFGLGVWQSAEGTQVMDAVSYALEIGYRGIDTAAIYRNEYGVGKAVKDSGVAREEIFVTTKLWNDDQRLGSTRKGFESSLRKLNMDYVDLYLIHWPVGDHVLKAWRVMEELYEEGKIRAIGVSNFLIHHLEQLLTETTVVPAVNQVEFHPYLIQPDLLDFCHNHGIAVEAWSPLMQGKFTSEDLFTDVGKKYQKTPAQVLLRWHIQSDVITIPKSVNKNRILENFQVFDFELEEEDMERINTLDRDHRFGPHPDNIDF